MAPLAKNCLKIARKFDHNKGETNGILAGLAYHNYEWEAANKYCSLAFKQNPNYPFPYWVYARNQIVVGNKETVEKAMNKLILLDPLTSTYKVFNAWFYAYNKEYDLPIKLIQDHLKMSPNDNHALWVLGYVHNLNKQHNKAIEIFESRTVKSNKTNWALGYAYARIGEIEKANEIAEFLVDKKENGTFVPAYMIGYVYMGIEDLDKAFYWFEKAYHERLGWLGLMTKDSSFDEVRNDERYISLVKRINLL